MALLATGPLRIALGLLFVLFFPGYSLIAALFPRKGALDGIERLALSLGLSIAVVPLIGLVLNYTPWGIRLSPILFSLLGFILAMAAIALFRRRRLLPEERFGVDFKVGLSQLSIGWQGQGRRDRVLIALLAVAIIGSLSALGYAVLTPKVGERFTEFYILGSEGKAADYPRRAILGQSSLVIVGIVNQEHEAMAYKVEVGIDGETVNEKELIALEHKERWEQKMSFVPIRAGPEQRVEFRLYRADESGPYRTLHLWIDVTEK